MWKKGVCLIVFVFILVNAKALHLDVALFYKYEITSVKIAVASGKYRLKADYDLIGHLKTEDSFLLKAENNKIQIYIRDSLIGKYRAVAFVGEGLMNSFHINPITNTPQKRTYDDDLKLTAGKGFLKIINHVSLERYVAGVVQSEGGGSSKDVEFYQVQAITCRTYALNNHRKHIKEGFNLCDDVHCQAYKGRVVNSDILMAVARTSGKVIVDEKKHMISASFHSNCGGQTINSEEVWSIPTSYLKSIRDTFCQNMPNARWSKKISRKRWLNYLKENFNYDFSQPGAMDSVLVFSQENRKKYLVNGIPLKRIRHELNLRSTYFEISTKADTVIFHGKGYGHGVGLCQEGAIRMARMGYSYRDIIHYYYTNVHIVNYQELPYLIEEFHPESKKAAF